MNKLEELQREGRKELKTTGHHTEEGFYVPDLDNAFDCIDSLTRRAFVAGLEAAKGFVPKEGAGHWEMDYEYCISCGEIKSESNHHFSWNACRQETLSNLQAEIEKLTTLT